MPATTSQALGDTAQAASARDARIGLALVRFTIGTMFVWVFFENLGKDLYTASGYAGLIRGYVRDGSAPAIWKSVMAFVENHASIAAPLQAVTEISFGVLLLLGVFTRLVAFLAFGYLTSLWISEWGTAWIWELLVPVLASLALSIGAAGRMWGIDSIFAHKRPSSLLW
jgi:uncharacterized membrane protein YphA (DoxX/SURF4 family)